MDDVSLIKLASTPAHEETARIMQICNACRYCEGFCAVFPAMERRRLFDVGDTAQLANLCHHCGACYHACQYAPPHEFAVNVPLTLAERRAETWAEFAWPGPLSGLFARNGLALVMIITAALALAVGLMLAMISPQLFWGGWPAFADAMSATATMRNLGGDNSGDGAGCPGPDDRNSLARRHYHHATFYGFMLCFASTSTGTIYHYLLGREAPYGYLELPVVLGTVGGIMLCVGTAGLWREKRRMEPAVRPLAKLGMDYAFIWVLFWVSATGLVLLALRETSFMGLTLAIHLGLVYGFFLVLPYSKFVHGLYRFAALLADAGEARRSAM